LVSERPRLQRYKSDRWVVWINSVGSAAPTPGEAIAEAALSMADARWCTECAGTAISRQWSGEEPPDVCGACNGTGDVASEAAPP
jgi:hypothetical protein